MNIYYCDLGTKHYEPILGYRCDEHLTPEDRVLEVLPQAPEFERDSCDMCRQERSELARRISNLRWMRDQRRKLALYLESEDLGGADHLHKAAWKYDRVARELRAGGIKWSPSISVSANLLGEGRAHMSMDIWRLGYPCSKG